jgi:hypothetical protein
VEERRGGMNKIVTVATAKNGKMREAIAAVKAVVEYMNSKFDLKNEAYVQLFGTVGTFYIMGEIKDLASIQAVQAKIMADEGYWALVQRYADVWDAPPKMTLLQSI